MSRLRDIAGSLSQEARGMTKKLPGVQVVVLVFNASDEAVSWVHDGEGTEQGWDGIASRLRSTAEGIRESQRAPR